MQIPTGATQAELEQAAKAYARKLYLHVLQLSLRAQVVIIFLCFINPPGIFGFFMSGAVLSGLFFCYALWCYTNREAEMLQTALMWWYVWVGLVYTVNFILRGLLCRKLSANLNYYLDATITDATPIPTPQHFPLKWEKDEEGTHWQNLVLINAPARGLYALEIVVENFNGSLESPPEGACAMHMEEISGDRIRYTGIYRLEKGLHWLATHLSNAEGNPPEAWLTQLNTPEEK